MDIVENLGQALTVTRCAILVRLNQKPFEVHHGEKPSTGSTSMIKDNKRYISEWRKTNSPVAPDLFLINSRLNSTKRRKAMFVGIKKIPCRSVYNHRSEDR